MKPPPTLREIQSCPTDIGPTIFPFGIANFTIYIAKMYKISYVNLMNQTATWCELAFEIKISLEIGVLKCIATKEVF